MDQVSYLLEKAVYLVSIGRNYFHAEILTEYIDGD